VTQPDNSAHRSSRGRTDSTHSAPARPSERRGGDRRPWPTASTTTRVSPVKPTTDTGRSRSASKRILPPTPATVWTAGTAPIDLDVSWPMVLIERIVTSFSKPAERVVLLDWSPLDHRRPTLSAVGADGVIDHAPDTEPDSELADIVAAIERLDRTAYVEHPSIDPTSTGRASQTFWADLVDRVEPAPATIPETPEAAVETPIPGATEPPDGVDLIVTSLPPHRRGEYGFGHAVDLVVLHAAGRLKAGGTLVVLTHCDWTSGELTDPTGEVVTAGQNADLLYLQHIVALHAPVRDGRFHLTDNDSSDDGDGQARAEHRAWVRGLPAPHRRIHSDVLVFVQPRDHQPTNPASSSARTDAVSQAEDIR
jgi:hypothetical protein